MSRKPFSFRYGGVPSSELLAARQLEQTTREWDIYRQVSFSPKESLWELAKETSFTQTIPLANPQPFVYFGNGPPAVSLCSTHLLGSLWGPADALTVSISKPDVFDRRIISEEPLTLARIREGCFDAANASDATPPLRGHYQYREKGADRRIDDDAVHRRGVRRDVRSLVGR